MRVLTGDRSSHYVARSESTAVAVSRSSEMRKFFVAFVAMLSIVAGYFSLSFAATGAANFAGSEVSSSVVAPQSARADSWLCVPETMGSGMDGKVNWEGNFKSYPMSDSDFRKWTIQEAFGNAAKFPFYVGEKSDSDRVPSWVKVDSEKLQSLNTLSNCGGSYLVNGIANFFIASASTFNGIAQALVGLAFSPNFICSDASQTDGCINLLAMVGGNGKANDNGGIVGALTNSLYFPLMVFMLIFAGFFLLKNMRGGSMRKALGQAFWIVGSFMLGLFLLLQPALITKAPLSAANIVTSCVMGAFTGQNCFTGGGTNSNIDFNPNTDATSAYLCRSGVGGGAGLADQTSLTTNAMTCEIWKAFIVSPVAQGSFGKNLDSLDTMRDKETRAAVEAAGFKPEDFCISMTSEKSVDAMRDYRLSLNAQSDQVCNLAVYQMFLMTNAEAVGPNGTMDSPPETGQLDERWYKIISVVAQDETMWNAWSASGISASARLGLGIFSLVASIFGSSIIIIVSASALVMLIASVVMIAFAPMFFLIGVEPTRGKPIMLGWVESLIANIAKYFAAVVVMLITVSLYAGVLGNTGTFWLTFIFILILSASLFIYRKEIMGMFGRVNMGGKQMSSSVVDNLTKRAQGTYNSTARTASRATGGAIGALATGAGLSGAVSSATDAVKRDLRTSSNNVIRGTVQQIDRNNKSNRDALVNKQKTAQARLEMVSDNKKEIEENRDDLQAQFDNENAAHEDNLNKIPEMEEKFIDYKFAVHESADAVNEHTNVMEQEILERIEASNAEAKAEIDEEKNTARKRVADLKNFEYMKSVEQALRDNKIQIELAEAKGDTKAVEQLKNDRIILDTELSKTKASLGPDGMKFASERLATILADGGDIEDLASEEERKLIVDAANDRINAINEKAKDNRNAIRKDGDQMKSDFAAVGEMKRLEADIREAEFRREESIAAGDTLMAERYDEIVKQSMSKHMGLESMIVNENVAAEAEEMFDRELAAQMVKLDIADFDESERENYAKRVISEAGYNERATSLREKLDNANAEYTKIEKEFVEATIENDVYTARRENLDYGENYSHRDAAKVEKKIFDSKREAGVLDDEEPRRRRKMKESPISSEASGGGNGPSPLDRTLPKTQGQSAGSAGPHNSSSQMGNSGSGSQPGSGPKRSPHVGSTQAGPRPKFFSGRTWKN